MFEKIIKEIRAFDTIIIHRHNNPDGDALGSAVGLKNIIRENFPKKTVYCVGDMSKRYSFIEDSKVDEIGDEVYSGALAVILDTSASALISDDRYRLAEKRIRIDHHIFCEEIAEVEYTDTSFESCCSMIGALAMECGLRLNSVAAKALYTGMITDSGRFRYDSTSSQTFRIAAFIRETPFDTNDIFRNLYSDEFEFIRLRASFVLKIAFTQKRVAYIYTTKEELEATGADTFSISRGMVNTMSEIRGVDIWVNFTETDAGVLCEIRSSKYNINPVAVKHGGGGHAKASGCTLADRDEAMAVLSQLEGLLEE